MYRIAVKRRLAMAFGGDFDPFPEPPSDAFLSPYAENQAAAETPPLALSWPRAKADPGTWQTEVRAKLAELSGWPRPDRPPTVLHAESVSGMSGTEHRRFYLRAFPKVDIPVDILWPEQIVQPAPVMICLQGTNSGAHLGWAEARMPPDPVKIASGLDFAHQAVAQGYVAVCIEQRCFGMRRERMLAPRSANPCVDAFHHGLLFGRTLVGDRASDVTAVVDWLETADLGFALDLERLHVMGHSTGGTMAVHAAALDGRLKAVIASGCLGPITDTLLTRRDGAGQNTIPGQLNWFELSDVVALCAPRPVLAVSGESDHIFPFAGVEKVVAGALPVYEAMGAAQRLRALELPGGHRFDPARIWPTFADLLQTERAD
jgi:dienelactone hydrolase